MNLPSDDDILLSVINTALRDECRSFEELCEEEDLDADEISARLNAKGYVYNGRLNAFKQA